MSCEQNTIILEKAYELAEENGGLSYEEIMSMDLEDAVEYLMNGGNKPC